MGVGRFITSFVTVFATVIAITKDLADVEGDLKYNIKTLATQLGVRGVAFLGVLVALSTSPMKPADSVIGCQVWAM